WFETQDRQPAPHIFPGEAAKPLGKEFAWRFFFAAAWLGLLLWFGFGILPDAVFHPKSWVFPVWAGITLLIAINL
ncbi:MAG: hypothetical protein GTN93_06840, partial [Anaerolineae bacterium]|nr:hypothetical protein [Anaerolineae bacterium]